VRRKLRRAICMAEPRGRPYRWHACSRVDSCLAISPCFP
jgi:hypothetical protein